MNRFDVLKRWAWSVLVMSALAFAMAGCEGDTGPQGATGAAGADGADGQDGVANITPLESCGVCHDDGSFASAPDAHAVPPIEMVSNVAFAVNGADLDVTFSLAVDGAPGLGYDTIERGYQADALANANICNATDGVCDTGSLTLTENGGGDYTLKVIGGAAAAATDYRYLFRVADGGEGETRVYFYGDTPASPFLPTIVSSPSCAACHGPEGIGIHGGYYQEQDASEPCLVCHGVSPYWAPTTVVPELMEVAHEYHNGLRDEITYPTYIENCSVCHSQGANLTAANAMPVSGPDCFSCHGGMDSDSWDFTGLEFHLNYDETTNCQACHTDPANGGIAREFVVEFHDGLETPRHGFIYGGLDTSIVEGDKFDWAITSMVDDDVNLTLTWEASYEGVPVDPCNATVGVGAPTFHLGNGSLRTYRSYAQGDDFIIGGSTSAPGQPDPRVNPDDTNTTCAGLIATTVIPVEIVAAEKGRIALGGKPHVISPDVAGLEVEARVPSPTFDWLLGDGTAVARRAIVDTELCLDCHVGSLYQHGGDRVDNVDYCLVCHNAASNEQNVRTGTMGVDPADAYDGRAGETFEMKTMVHRIHSAGESANPYVIYRGRGVYGFAEDESLLPNWPGTGSQVVYGSTIANDGTPGSYVVNHNFHAPTYPRGLYDCAACHVDGSVDFQPDQRLAMANTREAGSGVWEDQLDDTLQGAATTACVTCHADGAAKGHAYQNSWDPQEFPEGRQTIIDAAN